MISHRKSLTRNPLWKLTGRFSFPEKTHVDGQASFASRTRRAVIYFFAVMSSKMSASEIPTRSYMDDPKIKWKNQKPDFTLVDNKYMKERSGRHKADSLEKVVEDLVKTWEMESTHKVDEKDWQSVDKSVFTISTNGGSKATLQDNIDIGNYNILLSDCPLYDPKAETNESSHSLFRNAMPAGFAWEVLEVLSGPPRVAFTWRHWGEWEGEYKGNKPTGKRLEMFGSCVVNVTSDLKIQSIEVFYDPNPMMATLLKFDLKKACPAHKGTTLRM